MSDKITSLKIGSYKISNRVEMVKTMIDFICILKKARLSETEKLVLSYFMTEGYNMMVKEHIIEMGVLKNKQSLGNILTIFRKNGILIKEKFTEILAPDFRFPITPKININITLDNT